MNDRFVAFDEIRECLNDILDSSPEMPEKIECIYLVRDLFGKMRLTVSDVVQEDEACRDALQHLANMLHSGLSAHGYKPDEAVLYGDVELLNTLASTAWPIRSGIYLADRLISGEGWWTVNASGVGSRAKRITLYSVKGGVGRSTTAAVLAWHLARKGERVLVVDLDLESPGLSSAMLESERQPKFGVTDWFVEDLVGQGDHVISEMVAAPTWVQDLEGDVRVAPAHGVRAGEYLAKLGRVYMDADENPWTKRLDRLLVGLEDRFHATAILLESRSGLHDIAAATVTDLDAEVLLFATDGESTWTDYEILFRHWNAHGLARRIRERLSVVSALTPVPERESYLKRFRSRSWDLFREHLYDELDASAKEGEDFSFDLDEADAPHSPMEIDWDLGFAAGASLRRIDEATVESAYGRFLKPFEERICVPTALESL